MDQQPYIYKEIIKVVREYNPEYGDDRICRCGHAYYRHFDSYDDMADVGCKYCPCTEFVELDINKAIKEMVDEWHISPVSQNLNEYLGMTEEQYEIYQNNGTIPESAIKRIAKRVELEFDFDNHQ